MADPQTLATLLGAPAGDDQAFWDLLRNRNQRQGWGEDWSPDQPAPERVASVPHVAGRDEMSNTSLPLDQRVQDKASRALEGLGMNSRNAEHFAGIAKDAVGFAAAPVIGYDQAERAVRGGTANGDWKTLAVDLPIAAMAMAPGGKGIGEAGKRVTKAALEQAGKLGGERAIGQGAAKNISGEVLADAVEGKAPRAWETQDYPFSEQTVQKHTLFTPSESRKPPKDGVVGGQFTNTKLADALENPILPGDTRVSSRFPTAAGATEDPLRQHLSIGLKEALLDPKQLAHNTQLMSEYPGMAFMKGMAPEEAARSAVSRMSDNMDFIYKNSPNIMRQRSPLWYDGAGRFSEALSDRYGIPRQSSSAGVAVLSPQKDWFQNGSLAERVGDTVFGANQKWTSEMDAYLKNPANKTMQKPEMQDLYGRIKGRSLDQMDDDFERALWVRAYDEAHNPRRYREITPEGDLGSYVKNADGTPSKVAWGSLNEIDKSIRAFTSGGDADTISNLLGNKHKVRSFNNNIEVPNDRRFGGDVTADTHQVAAGLMRPLSGNTPEVAHNFGSSLAKGFQPEGYRGAKNSSVTGVQGTYPLVAEATRDFASKHGLLPRAGQSTVWEPTRELFTDVFKSDKKNIADINAIWRAHDEGRISAEQARQAILERAGGIGEPSWARSTDPVHDPKKSSTYR
jgi:hypothetical protein